MKNQWQLLWELQANEQEMKALTTQKKRITSDNVREVWNKLNQLLQAEKQDIAEMDALHRAIEEREQDLKGTETQYREMESKLYAGHVHNMRELEQIKSKVDEIKRDAAAKEESLLDLMEKSDQVEQRRHSRQDAISSLRVQHRTLQQEMVQAIAALEQQIAALEEKNQKLAAQIDEGILARYYALSKKLPTPVARVENGICSGCRMGVPSGQVLQGKEGSVVCDNCGRILILAPVVPNQQKK